MTHVDGLMNPMKQKDIVTLSTETNRFKRKVNHPANVINDYFNSITNPTQPNGSSPTLETIFPSHKIEFTISKHNQRPTTSLETGRIN
jgi:hypothetical protein